MRRGHYLTFAEVANGLRVTLTPEGREELADLQDAHPEWSDVAHFLELASDYLANGWENLAAEEIGALTGCEIILTADAERDDDGNLLAVRAPIYWHQRYAIELATERLANDGLFLLRA